MRDDVIVFRGSEVAVSGVVVRNTRHRHGLNLEAAAPRHIHGSFGTGRPTSIVIHDTVTVSARSGFHALIDRRGSDGRDALLGTGILIDADGILYQIVPDLALVTWHASGWSTSSIGLDMASLVDARLARNSPLRRPRTSWSERTGYLDYTPDQKITIKRAVAAICGATGIPFDCPRESNGSPATRGYGKGPVRSLIGQGGKYRGVVAHAQVSRARWDGNRALEILFGDGNRS